MWWAHNGCGFFPFGLIFLVFFLFLCFGIVRVLMFRCWGGYHRPWTINGNAEAEAILKRRLASGEITEVEYKQLKEQLKS